MTRVLTFCLLLAVLFFQAACSSTTEGSQPTKSGEGPGTASTQPQPSGEKPVGPFVASAKDDEAAMRRLIYCENALDNLHAAEVHQEYRRAESIKNVLRTKVRVEKEAMVRDLEFRPSPRFRQTMAAALGFAEDPSVLPVLYGALTDEAFPVVLHSLLSLYRLAGASVPVDSAVVVPYLNHPRKEIRSNAALVLSRSLTPESPREHLLPLISAAQDTFEDTRVHAIAAMTRLKDQECVPHMIKALGDDVSLVRFRAAAGLGILEAKNATPYLVDALDREGETEEVKKVIALALKRIVGDTPEKGTWTYSRAWRQLLEPKGLLKR